MKIAKNSIGLGIALLITFAISIIPTYAQAQTTEGLSYSNFLITVKTTPNQIYLTCTEGCSWKNLSFNTPVNGTAVDIDQYGTVENQMKPLGSMVALTPFHFILSMDQGGVVLEGKEGTAWTQLTFGCPKGGCNQEINYQGMTNK